MSTADVTDVQIDRLRDEAASVGDLLTVALCNRAQGLQAGAYGINGDVIRQAAAYTETAARRKCGQMIAVAEAMRDE